MEVDFDVVLEAVRRRFEALEALVEAASQGHAGLHAEIDHRHRQSFEERDKRYEQRFHAQEKAVELALARVDKEFHEHIASVRTETRAALEAADKAINKSEVATEKRFESVNEFRAQLNDQAAKFMGRDESISRHERTAESLAGMATRHENEMRLLRERFEMDVKTLRDRHESSIAQINSRLDLTQGKDSGVNAAWAAVVGAVGVVGGVIAIVIAVAR